PRPPPPPPAAPPDTLPDAQIDVMLQDARRSGRLRAGSFIITTFGDVVAPRGGTVSLASLIRFLQPFGINDSQVRTAVSRLAADGWLQGQRRGRNSFYGLTEPGARRFAAATRRIYDAGELEWEGRWQVVIYPDGGPARDALRRELGWAGFGALAPGLFLHPNPPEGAVQAALEVLDLTGRAVVIDGRRGQDALPETLHLTAQGCWALDGVAEAYAAFAERFAALAASLAGDGPSQPPASLPHPAAALQARVLLIHDYRRALLRDPLLPSDFLPADWPGHAARQRAMAIYRALAPAAEAGIDALLTGPDGPLPAPSAAFRQRFGGLAG
ncbi:phenylacetic acid degradation operon negative regulatory protein PaaX, partial [Marinibaculum pumilum]